MKWANLVMRQWANGGDYCELIMICNGCKDRCRLTKPAR
jgi:hypothetical protein